MFCTKCGKDNSDEAIYCQKCGALLGKEEETRVAARRDIASVDDEETEIFSINPSLIFVKFGYALTVIGAVFFVALFTVLTDLSVWILIPFGLLLLLIPAFFHLRQKLVRYTLKDTTIEIDKGLISKTTQNVPLRRIQDVTVSATVPQRMLGFGDLLIDNASEDGTKIVMKNIDSPRKYADILMKQMRRLER